MATQTTDYQTAVDEGSTAAAQAIERLPRAMRGNRALMAIVIGVLDQMQKQRPDWFNALSNETQQALAIDLITAAKAKLNAGSLP